MLHGGKGFTTVKTLSPNSLPMAPQDTVHTHCPSLFSIFVFFVTVGSTGPLMILSICPPPRRARNAIEGSDVSQRFVRSYCSTLMHRRERGGYNNRATSSKNQPISAIMSRRTEMCYSNRLRPKTPHGGGWAYRSVISRDYRIPTFLRFR